jgi:hypothetical protein
MAAAEIRALERELDHARAIAAVSIGQPDRAQNVAYRGGVIRTSMSRRSPVVVRKHASGKAVDTRLRGGPWRASKPGVKPKP